jgi:hypothetical protein
MTDLAPSPRQALALAQCQRVARSVLNLGGKVSVIRLARKLGVAESVVLNRIKSRTYHNTNGYSTEFTYFAFDNVRGVWGVTTAGRQLARSPKLPGYAEAFRGAAGFTEPVPEPAASRRILCPACGRTRTVGFKRAVKHTQHPDLPRLCGRCSREAFGVVIAAAFRAPREPATDTDSRLAQLPTQSAPGSEARFAVYALRAELKLPLCIPGDRDYYAGLSEVVLAELERAGEGRAEGGGGEDEPDCSDSGEAA